jgi:hypothetical protein
VNRLLEAAKGNRNEARYRCLLMLITGHGLRVSGACRMKLDQVDADSRAACRPSEARAIDDAAVTRRRAVADRRLAEGPGPHEGLHQM